VSGPWIIDTECWLEASVVCHPVIMLCGVTAFLLGGLLDFAIMIADVLAAEGIGENSFANALWEAHERGG